MTVENIIMIIAIDGTVCDAEIDLRCALHSKPPTAIVMMNMGGPSTQEEVRDMQETHTHVCTYTFTHKTTRARTRTHIRVSKWVRVQANMHAYKYMCIYAGV